MKYHVQVCLDVELTLSKLIALFHVERVLVTVWIPSAC